MRQEIEEDVIRRVMNITGHRKPIRVEDEIYHDLQIAGDDAIELLDGIHKTYATAFGDLNFEKYFPNETEALWFYIKSRLRIPDRSRRSLTVGHLVSVVEQGVWFDAPPECP